MDLLVVLTQSLLSLFMALRLGRKVLGTKDRSPPSPMHRHRFAARSCEIRVSATARGRVESLEGGGSTQRTIVVVQCA